MLLSLRGSTDGPTKCQIKSECFHLMCPPWVVLDAQAPQSAGYYVNLLFLLSHDIEAAWRDANVPMMPLG